MAKIFVLDDDEMQNILNKLLFKTIGITDVDYRTTGKEALEYLEVCKNNSMFPDLMFVDLNLTGMGGIEFVRQYELQYRKYSSHLSIIILSNSAYEEHQEAVLKYESVIKFWSKPLNKNKLTEILQLSNKTTR